MPTASLRIVVADDDQAIVRFLSDLLGDEGHQVLCCTSGAEAQATILRTKPDVAILDLQMETRDAGLRVLQNLRQHPETTHIAVIICSADNHFLEIHRDAIMRHRGVLTPKPFDTPKLLSTVNALILPAP